MCHILQVVHAVGRREAVLAALGALLLSPAAAQAGFLGGGPDKNEIYTQDTVSVHGDGLQPLCTRSPTSNVKFTHNTQLTFAEHASGKGEEWS